MFSQKKSAVESKEAFYNGKWFIIIAFILMVASIALLTLGGLIYFRDSPLIVFICATILSFLFISMGNKIGIILTKPARKKLFDDLKTQFIRQPFENKKKSFWDSLLSSFILFAILGQLIGLIISGLFYRIFEGYIANISDSILKYVSLYVISYILTVILMVAIGFIAGKVARLSIKIAMYIQKYRLTRIVLFDNGAEMTEAVIGKLIIGLTSFIFVISPFMVIFSDVISRYVILILSLTLTTVPLFKILSKRKYLPDTVFFELPRFFIPLQILLGLALLVIIVGGYSIIYTLRFNFGDSFGLTFPFNIPRSYDNVFEYPPQGIPLAEYVEMVSLGIVTAILLTWISAVIIKKAWLELFTGMLAGVIIFAVPFIQKNFPIAQNWITTQARLFPAFILGVTIPFLMGLFLQTIANFFASRNSVCPYCFYEKLDMYHLFCPRCGKMINGRQELFREWRKRRLMLANKNSPLVVGMIREYIITLKNHISIPYKINDIFTLTDIQQVDTSLYFFCRIENIKSYEVDTESFLADIRPDVIQNTLMNFDLFLDHGVKIIYSYQGSDKKWIADIVIDLSTLKE